jgi:hypothetical protein
MKADDGQWSQRKSLDPNSIVAWRRHARAEHVVILALSLAVLVLAGILASAGAP